MASPTFDALGPSSLAGILLALYVAKCLIYSLYFDPLRHFPGPLAGRFTVFAYISRLLRGHMAKEVLALHEKYGPVVRIDPTHLSFIEPEAWKDIYSRRTDLACGLDELPKDPAFYIYDGFELSLVNESREVHAVLRKMLAPGFSDRAMREQEPIIASYVELLIHRLHENCMVSLKAAEVNSDTNVMPEKTNSDVQYVPLDMHAWYNWTTFDIIGDLALGEPFGCLKNAQYHSWVSAIVETIQYMGIIMTVNMLNITKYILPILAKISPGLNELKRISEEKIQRRMDLEVCRPDFMESLLQQKKNNVLDLPVERIASTASLIVLAGSETTASLLAGATYLLLRHPENLAKVTAEVRSRFSSPKDITLLSVNSDLPYLHACLNECMRMYPPQPIGMPRITPKGGANIAGVFVPENISVACWQLATNYSSENWHEPYEFKPQRFVEGGNILGDRLDAMQPFHLGPRNCIGKNLAYAEMRLIMAQILFHFDMELADPNFDWMDQTTTNLWNKEALNIYLKPVHT